MKKSENDLHLLVLALLKELKSETPGIWKDDSKFIEVRRLQIDKRGSLGERLILESIRDRHIQIDYRDGGAGAWDIKINGFGFETKTASLGQDGKKFQNEGIQNTDQVIGYLFVGVAPKDIYVHFVRRENALWDKLHNRKAQGTGSGYKWDLSPRQMTKVTSLAEINALFKKVFPEVFPKKSKKPKEQEPDPNPGLF